MFLHPFQSQNVILVSNLLHNIHILEFHGLTLLIGLNKHIFAVEHEINIGFLALSTRPHNVDLAGPSCLEEVVVKTADLVDLRTFVA